MRNSETKVRRRYGPAAISRMDEGFLQAVLGDGDSGGIARGACATIIAGALSYGFAFGVWRSPLQGLYSALKMPLLFFSTILAGALINTMLAQLIGTGLSLRRVCMAMLLGMAVAAGLMGALSPVVLFFALQVPSPDPAVVGLAFDHPAVTDSRHAYWMLLLGHVGIIGLSGTVGMIRLFRLLMAMTGNRRTALRLMVLWFCVCGFVGCELSWLLSPFLCKPTQLPHIFPREYFQENFYERVWRGLTELM